MYCAVEGRKEVSTPIRKTQSKAKQSKTKTPGILSFLHRFYQSLFQMGRKLQKVNDQGISTGFSARLANRNETVKNSVGA